MNTLRALISSHEGGALFEAQLLELDIAVSASSLDGLIAEIEHAIIMEYRLAKHYGNVPFVSFVNRVPGRFVEAWESTAEDAIGTRALTLPDDVSEALAIALHAANRKIELRTHRLAA